MSHPSTSLTHSMRPTAAHEDDGPSSGGDAGREAVLPEVFVCVEEDFTPRRIPDFAQKLERRALDFDEEDPRAGTRPPEELPVPPATSPFDTKLNGLWWSIRHATRSMGRPRIVGAAISWPFRTTEIGFQRGVVYPRARVDPHPRPLP